MWFLHQRVLLRLDLRVGACKTEWHHKFNKFTLKIKVTRICPAVIAAMPEIYFRFCFLAVHTPYTDRTAVHTHAARL